MKCLSFSTKSRFSAAILLMLSLSLSLVSISSQADEDNNAPDPSTRVARVSYLQGSVSLQLAQSDDWVSARLNRPLTNRDQIFTDGGSRAELQIGMATVHLDENTQLGLMELSDNVLQLQLNQGVLNVTIRGMDDDDTIEIDTPNAAVTIPEPGSYRIQVGDKDDLTIVQVNSGSAEVAGERQRYTVQEKEQLRLRGSKRLNAQFDDLDRQDDFDRWVAARNSRARNATASRYVDANVIGYEDLDDYGYWGWEADYGNVWYPNRVATGWSPYRYGHWEWIAPWGWTWIDDAPWGFAPFHYGRWAQVHHRWCWVPGRREVRAVYAPALVAWVGTPGASVSVSVGSSVGWIPLGPREIFHPHYHASAVYLSRVNVSNSLLDRNEYERLRHSGPRDEVFVNRGAASVVASATFTSAVNVQRNLLPGGHRDLRPIDRLNDLRPARAAIIGGPRVITPPSRVIDREVVVQRRPSPIAPRADVHSSRSVPVGGSIRVIEPTAPRRDSWADRRNNSSLDRNVGAPVQRDESVNPDIRDNRRFDRSGRSNEMENRNDADNGRNQPRREWRVVPQPERREPIEPGNEQRTTQPRQSPPEQPERRRIGPWIRDEQQLRPAPSPQQREPQVSPPPRAEPPRPMSPPPSSPPPNNSSDNNRGGDHGGHRPSERREIR